MQSIAFLLLVMIFCVRISPETQTYVGPQELDQPGPSQESDHTLHFLLSQRKLSSIQDL